MSEISCVRISLIVVNAIFLVSLIFYYLNSMKCITSVSPSLFLYVRPSVCPSVRLSNQNRAARKLERSSEITKLR